MSVGRVVASKYCLLYELGRGGMGEVWAAEHLSLRTRVAVKLIDPKLAGSAEARQRFEREARAAATLRSQHVVQVLDFGLDNGRPYLVMELLHGESLASRLTERDRLSPGETWTVMSQVGKAMTRAHSQGFVHRDLKPDNIFLVDDEAELLVKVLDFGIAKALDRTPTGGPITYAGAVLGTPHHMSPEQAEGRPVDARSDLFSMGVIAFECITGRVPWQGASLPALLRSICYDPIIVPSRVTPVPAGFDAWFARAVERDVRGRFQTAKELVDTLEPLLQQPASEWVGPRRAGARASGAAGEQEPSLHLDTFPGKPADRRGEARIPSSIPAGINRQRDLAHAALIHNTSRHGALLATRQGCEIGQLLILTLQLAGEHAGATVLARVVRVTPRHGAMWRFDVAVELETPLTDALLAEIERRANASAEGGPPR